MMRLLSAVAVCTLAIADPALARPDQAQQEQPSPWVAAAASGLAAPAVGIAATVLLGTVGQSPGSFSAGLPTFLALGLSPLLMGSGQYYAGDHDRAMGVGWTGVGVTFAGTVSGVLLVMGLDALAPPAPVGTHPETVMGLFLGGLAGYGLSFLGYDLWSAADAYQTTIRMNQPVQPAAPNKP
jgi:hypothetical protein